MWPLGMCFREDDGGAGVIGGQGDLEGLSRLDNSLRLDNSVGPSLLLFPSVHNKCFIRAQQPSPVCPQALPCV